jgi:aspartate racemase
MLPLVMNDAVRWNPDEKIIGVVGVAPAATADFYTKLVQLTPVKKDWEHVRIIIDSNPKIPSRGRYFELGETDPVPFIQESIENLYRMGANIIALPCNTAHILYEKYATHSGVIIPHMIEATAKEVVQQSTSPGKVAVFASRLTQQHQLYDNVFKQYQWQTLDTSLHQADVSYLIEGVKQGQPLQGLKQKMQMLLSAYSEADIFVMGCTELSLLIDESEEKVIIDSNIALAKACLRESRNAAFNKHVIAQLLPTSRV